MHPQQKLAKQRLHLGLICIGRRPWFVWWHDHNITFMSFIEKLKQK